MEKVYLLIIAVMVGTLLFTAVYWAIKALR